MRRPNLSVRSMLVTLRLEPLALSKTIDSVILSGGSSALAGEPESKEPYSRNTLSFSSIETVLDVQGQGRQSARGDTARLSVSFPSTGGVDVSLHTLGPAERHGTPPPQPWVCR